MKRRFEEERIHRLQNLVNEVIALSGKESQQVRVRGYRYIPKILFTILMIVEIDNIWSLNRKVEGIFHFLQVRLQKLDVKAVIARADEELAKWEHTPSAEIPHAVKTLKYHLEELRLDYDL